MSYKVQRDKKYSKLLSSLNVPARYQIANIDGIFFSPILASWDKNKIVTPDKQQSWMAKIMQRIKKKKPLSTKIMIHSRPTDDSAMRVAFKIMMSALDNGYSAKAYNLGFFVKNFENDSNIEYDVLVLYSINPNSSSYKIDMLRDLLRKCDKSIVIVVTTCPKFGDEAYSALDFNYTFLNYRFNGYLQIDEIE